MHSERRVHHRYVLGNDAFAMWGGGQTRIKNASRGGALLEGAASFSLGSVIELTLDMPWVPTIRVPARVVRAIESPRRPQKTWAVRWSTQLPEVEQAVQLSRILDGIQALSLPSALILCHPHTQLATLGSALEWIADRVTVVRSPLGAYHALLSQNYGLFLVDGGYDYGGMRALAEITRRDFPRTPTIVFGDPDAQKQVGQLLEQNSSPFEELESCATCGSVWGLVHREDVVICRRCFTRSRRARRPRTFDDVGSTAGSSVA